MRQGGVLRSFRASDSLLKPWPPPPFQPLFAPRKITIPPIGCRRTTSRRNRRCSAPYSSTTTPSTAFRTSSSRGFFRGTASPHLSTSRAQLIRAGKLATPITLKTFLGEHESRRSDHPAISGAARGRGDDDHQCRGLRPHDPRSRRAARAHPHRRGHGQRRLSMRRSAVRPRDQIEEAERKLYSIAEAGRYDGGFQRFSDALTIAVDMAAKAWERDGRLSGIATGLYRARQQARRPASFRPRDHRRPPRHGQDRARHQYRLQHRQGLSNSRRAPTAPMRR